MKIIETTTGGNTVEEIENDKELIVRHVHVEPRSGDYMSFEYKFERGKEFAKLTHIKYERQEKTILWAIYLEAKEYDELISQVKQITQTNNPIDMEAKISRFVSYIFERYYKPDP